MCPGQRFGLSAAPHWPPCDPTQSRVADAGASGSVPVPIFLPNVFYFFLSLPESQNVSHPSSGMVLVQECFILVTGAFPAQQGLKLLPLGLYKVRVESRLQ